MSDKVLNMLNMSLQHVEPLLAPRSYPSEYPPVFIIGAPRSGSTLLYQVLVNRFRFGYFNNLHRKYYGFPYLLQLLLKPRAPYAFTASYASTHGCTEEIWGPSENGTFWYRWFPQKPQYVPLHVANLKKMSHLKRVVAGLISVFNAPVLFKNLHCALRLRPLAKVFPDALFLVIRRDSFMMTQSILEGRKRVHGDLRKWWSVEPPHYEEWLHLEPEEQVVLQVQSIYDLIASDAAGIGADRFFSIQYEDFCADVHGTTERVRVFLKEHGVSIQLRGDVPAVFTASHEIKLDASTSERLIAALKKYAV